MSASLAAAHEDIDGCSRTQMERAIKAALRSKHILAKQQEHDAGLSLWKRMQCVEASLLATADGLRGGGPQLVMTAAAADLAASAANTAVIENDTKIVEADQAYAAYKLEHGAAVDFSALNTALFAEIMHLKDVDTTERKHDVEGALRLDGAQSTLETMHRVMLESSAVMNTANHTIPSAQGHSKTVTQSSGVHADMFNDDNDVSRTPTHSSRPCDASPPPPLALPAPLAPASALPAVAHADPYKGSLLDDDEMLLDAGQDVSDQ